MTTTTFNPTDWFNLTPSEFLQIEEMTNAELIAACSWMTNVERSVFRDNLIREGQRCIAEADALMAEHKHLKRSNLRIV